MWQVGEKQKVECWEDHKNGSTPHVKYPNPAKFSLTDGSFKTIYERKANSITVKGTETQKADASTHPGTQKSQAGIFPIETPLNVI